MRPVTEDVGDRLLCRTPCCPQRLDALWHRQTSLVLSHRDRWGGAASIRSCAMASPFPTAAIRASREDLTRPCDAASVVPSTGPGPGDVRACRCVAGCNSPDKPGDRCASSSVDGIRKPLVRNGSRVDIYEHRVAGGGPRHALEGAALVRPDACVHNVFRPLWAVDDPGPRCPPIPSTVEDAREFAETLPRERLRVHSDDMSKCDGRNDSGGGAFYWCLRRNRAETGHDDDGALPQPD
jgi:hypothetical protein